MLMLNLPEANYYLPTAKENEKIKLAVIGGRGPVTSWFLSLPDWETICADRGGEYASKVNRQISLLVGDIDSGSGELYQKVSESGGKVISCSRDKDDTDLQLLLTELMKEPCHIVVAGAFGGRLDHLQSNIHSLMTYKLCTGKQVVLADGKETLVLLQKKELCIVDLKTVQLPTISLLPLAEKTVVTTDHVRWPLEKRMLSIYCPNALSNRPVDNEVWAQCDEGKLGFYFCFDEADL